MEKLNPEDILSIEELKPEDILSVEEQEKPKSTLESIGESASDIARGVGSGITMGGLEELIAAGQATFSSGEDEWSKKYRKFLEIQEQKTKEAEERSPTLMMGGEIVGSLAPALLTGGTALGLTGGRAAAQLGGKQLLKAAGKAALVEGAFGTGAGGLTGALTSEEGRLIGSTPKERSKLWEDIKSGALTGGVIGAGMGAASPYAGKVIKAAKEKGSEAMDKFLLTGEMKTAFELGEQGKGQITKKQRNLRLGEKKQAVSFFKEALLTAEDVTADQFKKPLSVASEMGAVVKPTETNINRFGKASDLFRSFGYEDVADELISISVDGVSPSKAYQLRSKLKDLSSQNNQFGGFIQPLIKNIDDQIENSLQTDAIQEALIENNLSTSYKKGLKTYSDFLKSTIEAILEEGRPPDARGKFFYDLDSRNKKLYDQLDYVVSHLELPGTTSEAARNSLLNEEGGMVPMLSKMIKDDPETLNRIAQETGERLGISFKDANDFKTKLVNKMHRASTEAVTSRVTQGEREIASGIGIGDLLSRKPLVWGSNLVGQAKYYTKDFAKQLSETAPGKFSSYVYNMPENKLRSISTRYYEDPKYGKYAKQLATALDAGDNVKKQAVLFALIQQPDFRNKLPDMIGETEDEQ